MHTHTQKECYREVCAVTAKALCEFCLQCHLQLLEPFCSLTRWGLKLWPSVLCQCGFSQAQSLLWIHGLYPYSSRIWLALVFPLSDTLLNMCQPSSKPWDPLTHKTPLLHPVVNYVGFFWFKALETGCANRNFISLNISEEKEKQTNKKLCLGLCFVLLAETMKASEWHLASFPTALKWW